MIMYIVSVNLTLCRKIDGEIIRGHNLYVVILHGEIINRGEILHGEILRGEIIHGEIINRGEILYGEILRGEILHGEILRAAKCMCVVQCNSVNGNFIVFEVFDQTQTKPTCSPTILSRRA